jgi:hypothetical protein
MGQNGGHCWDVNHQNRKSFPLMEMEQRHVIQFLHFKCLKFDEITPELSSAYGRDIGYLISSPGKPVSKCNVLRDDGLSTILALKSYQFFGNSRSRQCERLLTP